VQINADLEKTKGGISPEELSPFLESLSGLKHLRVLGLMCIPAPGNTRPAFARTRGLLEKANASSAYPLPLKELSMGMSADFPDAIAEGSTLVRLGTLLFGERS
jgi:uncharacterized pyridoxal phosphate-containing UPF0001 family protein